MLFLLPGFSWVQLYVLQKWIIAHRHRPMNYWMERHQGLDHGIRTYDGYMTKLSQPKFISQNPNENYLKISYNLIFLYHNGWLMENPWLGTHNDKICADSSTGDTPNTPQFIWLIICLKYMTNYLGYIWEISSHHMSIVHGLDYS